MSTNKSCTNCPGATDHDTAHCPLRVIHLGSLDPEQRLALARGVTITQSRMGFGDKRRQGVGYWIPEQAEGAQGARPPLNVLAQALNGEMILITLGTPIRQLAVPVDHLADFTDAPDVVVIRPRAALAQPSPAPELDDEYVPEGIVEAALNDSQVDAVGLAAAALAPELERPEGWDNHHERFQAGFMVAEAQHDRVVRALRAEIEKFKAANGDISSKLLGRRMAVIRLKAENATLREERDAAQDRVAELEKLLEGSISDKKYRGVIDCLVNPFRKEAKEACAELEAIKSQKPIAYVLFRDGEIFWAPDDGIVISDTPGDEDERHTWQPVYAAPVAQAGQVPDVLFDGFAVYQALSDKAKGRTTSHHVSDTLDAVVKLMRAAAPAQGGSTNE